MRGYRWADEAASFADMLRKVPKSVAACYDLIETQMLKGPWMMGDACRPVPVHFRAMAGRRRRQSRPLSARYRSSLAHVTAAQRQEGDCGGVCMLMAAAVYPRRQLSRSWVWP